MPTKISKVAKDLNVGVNTAVEFLRKHNIVVEEGNPNVRIDDNAVELLMKEYSKDKDSKVKSDKFSQTRKNERKSTKNDPRHTEEIKVKTNIAGPRIVGTIDLNTPANEKKPAVVKETPAPKPEPAAKAKPEAKAEPKPEAKPAPAPKPQPERQAPAEQNSPKTETPKADTPKPEPQKKETIKPDTVKPDTPKTDTPKQAEPEKKDDNGVFRYTSVAPAPQLKVLGKVNLDEINQSTRPKKKNDHRRGGQNGRPGDNADRKKRKRIGKEKVDIEKAGQTVANTPRRDGDAQGGNRRGGGGGDRNRNDRGGDRNQGNKRGNKRAPRVEVSTEDVQKQMKETLARLTNKTTKKSVKWRKEKREEMHNREIKNAEREAAEAKTIKITEFVTANDLANLMEVPINSIIATCMNLGVMVSINQRLDAETINIVAEEFGFTTEYVSAEVSEAITTEEDAEEDLESRPPIVTVMGHVDHGKTSLLDYIRNANVIAGEAGGITQHIGAYNVKLNNGRHITFLDTPGHEAFTAMRARGAKVTDLAIIIVAADDDVMPQTVEAINHASAAGVPIVFAINKIDKPTANPDKIKEQLAAMNYLVEDWGGKYQSQDISAKKGIGVEELMDKVLLESDMLELRANPNRNAIGSVIESSLDKGRGYVATVLVQNGTLRVGDVILAGTNYGKVKAMFNERNQRVTEAGPATPVLILGLNGAPTAGDTFNVLDTEQEAREIAGKREQLQREMSLRTKKRPGLEELAHRRALNDFHELNLVVKGDVDGSVEALSDSLIKLSTPEVQVNVLHKGVGAISESDVTLAAASDAIIIGFQVRPSGAARREAEKEGVEIRLYSVIYKAIEEVKDAMEGMLAPEIKEEITGTAEVLQTYKISKVGTIAGAIVREGIIKRTNKVRVIRDGIVRYTGDLGSLKRFKDDVKEVTSGYECGLSVQGYNDIMEGDLIEGFEEVEVKKTL